MADTRLAWRAVWPISEAPRAPGSATEDELRRSRRVVFPGSDLSDLLSSDDEDDDVLDLSNVWPQCTVKVDRGDAPSWDRRRQHCFDGSESYCGSGLDFDDDDADDEAFVVDHGGSRGTARSPSVITRGDTYVHISLLRGKIQSTFSITLQLQLRHRQN